MIWIGILIVSIRVAPIIFSFSDTLSKNAMRYEDYTVIMFRWSDIVKLIGIGIILLALFSSYKTWQVLTNLSPFNLFSLAS